MGRLGGDRDQPGDIVALMSEMEPGAWAGKSYLLSTGSPSLETVIPGRKMASMNCL